MSNEIFDDIEKWVKQGREYGEALLAIGATLTEDQEQFNRECDLTEMYLEWKRSLPHLEEAQWLHIFPQAKKRYGRLIKGKLKIEKRYVFRAIQQARISAVEAIRANTPENAWRDDLIRESLQSTTRCHEKRIKRIDALVQLVERTGKKASQKEDARVVITPKMIEQARAYPLDQLIEINPRTKFAKCLWHNDKTPSMFCKNNYVHCFSCQNGGDTIEVLMKRDGIGFREAVIELQ